MRKASDSNKPALPTTNIITDKYVLRFLSKLVENAETGCLEYQGAVGHNGYGVFHDGTKSVLAHRYSYETFKDDLPTSGVIMHSCSNKACCNWDHLSAGTHKQNSQDAVRDGLIPSTRRPYRKATATEIADIRTRAANGETVYSISKLYDRGYPYIAGIVSGRLHDPNKPVKVEPSKKQPKPQPVASTSVQEVA